MDTFFDIIQSLSIIIASSVAIWGIGGWRREIKWKRKYELAEEVLVLFFNAEESIARIRSPFANINEGKSREKSPNEKESESDLLDQAFVAIERYQEEKEVFINIRKIKHRFRAVFGKDRIKPFEELDKILKEIFISAQMLGQVYWQNQGKEMSEEAFEKHLNKMTEYESVFWSGVGNPDTIKERVKEVITEIDSICGEIIRKR